MDFCFAGAIFCQGCSQVFEAGHFFQFLPSIMMLTLALFVLFTITLDFAVLISIPYAPGCCNEFVGEFLQLTVTAHHEVDIICEV